MTNIHSVAKPFTVYVVQPLLPDNVIFTRLVVQLPIETQIHATVAKEAALLNPRLPYKLWSGCVPWVEKVTWSGIVFL